MDMKRIFSIILVFALVSCVAMAQRALMIRHADGVTDAVSTAAIDSLEFSDDGRGIDANGNVTISDDGTEVKITNSGAASKAVKVGNSENIGTFTLNGGTLTANISGTMVLRDLSQRLPLQSAVARITSSAMTTA